VFGQGVSLTLRDARTLSEKLQGNNDWDRAGHEYADEHQHYFPVMHTSCEWLRQVFQERTLEADQRRAIAMPLIAEDPTRVPDHIISGPELRIDDSVRARFFGEQDQAAQQCA
jgi:menaquinone-9 beta-reductase